MIRTDLLRGVIAQKGTSQRKVAKELGITEKTFYQKAKGRVDFAHRELEGIAKILGLTGDQILEIFFAAS